jgi:hypothetical protein
MARRMFSSQIVNSDPFLDMPVSVQALYFHLGMNADDEGFVYPKQVMRQIGAAQDDLSILLAKKFIIPFDSGVIVLKHWNVNNTIRYDRRRQTTHGDARSMLSLDKSGVYHLVDNQQAASRVLKEVSKEVNKEDLLRERGELTSKEKAERSAQIRHLLKGKMTA